MIPDFQEDGNLPPGVHWTCWAEIEGRFGKTPWRRELLRGLRAALMALKTAGCETAYLDGSFVTDKEAPADFDACWDISGVDLNLLDPVLRTFDSGRATQKAKYLGELFPSAAAANPGGDTFLDFFQADKNTGKPKGIIALALGGLT